MRKREKNEVEKMEMKERESERERERVVRNNVQGRVRTEKYVNRVLKRKRARKRHTKGKEGKIEREKKRR